MEIIGLLTAMPLERDAVLRQIKGWKRTTVGPYEGISFDAGGKTCLLVTSGMGVRRASEAARTLVEWFAPRVLISFGIAGAVGTDLQIGDVVTAEAVCWLEAGGTGPLLPLASWPELAREEAARALSSRGVRLFSGTALTTGGSQIVGVMLTQNMHPILEMETAGIAEVAAEKGIPCLSLRAISDRPSDPIPFNLGEMMDADANLQVGKLIKTILHNPRIHFQLRRFVQNSRLAADNAAIALMAAMRQTD